MISSNIMKVSLGDKNRCPKLETLKSTNLLANSALSSVTWYLLEEADAAK